MSTTRGHGHQLPGAKVLPPSQVEEHDHLNGACVDRLRRMGLTYITIILFVGTPAKDGSAIKLMKLKLQGP